MSNSPVLRPFEQTDYADLNRLFKKAFDVDRSVDSWVWKYELNPHGPAVATVATVAGVIVGFYGLIPRHIRLMGETMTGFQEVDLMVDSAHAQGGLFKNLGRLTYDRLTQMGHSFTFGFPNQTSLPPGKRILGWKAIERIPLWTMLLKPAEVLTDKIPGIPGLRTGIGWAVQLYNTWKLRSAWSGIIRESDAFDDGVIDLITRANASSDIVFIRNKDYLRWRYLNVPHNHYRLFIAEKEGSCCAMAVVGLGEAERGNIAEFHYDPHETSSAVALLAHVARFCSENGCSTLRVWALENSGDARFFAKLGFFNRNALNYHVIRSFRSPEFNRYLLDGRRWRISSGDSDCV